jgi:NMD protein affecting ribosome stability and mRNA decay
MKQLITCYACGCEADPTWTEGGHVYCTACFAETFPLHRVEHRPRPPKPPREPQQKEAAE